MLPWYVVISYFAWLIISLVTIKYSKFEKWYEQTVIAFILTLIFTAILITGISNVDNIMFDNDTAMWYIAPTLNLPAIYWFGLTMKKKAREKEKQRIDEVTHQIELLYAKYKPLDHYSISYTENFVTDTRLINREVNLFIKYFITKIKGDIEERQDNNSRINKILACPDCSTVDEKLSFLIKHENNMASLKSDNNILTNKIEGTKIRILNENAKLLSSLRMAFYEISHSKKCISDSISITDLIKVNSHDALSLFYYESPPMILDFQDNVFCLFSNVIIMLDSKGNFVTALDPTALIISIKKEQKDISLRSNETLEPTSSAVISDDSKCIKRGSSYQRYEQTYIGRYKYRYVVEYHDDTYEYGIITISILDYTVSYTVSSQAALESFEVIAKDYCVNHSNKHDTVPDLLLLLSGSTDNHETINMVQTMAGIYRHNKGNSNYFCTEVNVEN